MTSFIGNSKELYWYFDKAIDPKKVKKVLLVGNMETRILKKI